MLITLIGNIRLVSLALVEWQTDFLHDMAVYLILVSFLLLLYEWTSEVSSAILLLLCLRFIERLLLLASLRLSKAGREQVFFLLLC